MQQGVHGSKWKSTSVACGNLNPGSSIKDQALGTATGDRGRSLAGLNTRLQAPGITVGG